MISGLLDRYSWRSSNIPGNDGQGYRQSPTMCLCGCVVPRRSITYEWLDIYDDQPAHPYNSPMSTCGGEKLPLVLSSFLRILCINNRYAAKSLCDNYLLPQTVPQDVRSRLDKSCGMCVAASHIWNSSVFHECERTRCHYCWIGRYPAAEPIPAPRCVCCRAGPVRPFTTARFTPHTPARSKLTCGMRGSAGYYWRRRDICASGIINWHLR